MKKIKVLNITNIIYRFISSILFFNIINLFKNNFNFDISFMQQLNIFSVISSLIFIFIILSFISHIFKNNHIDYLITIISLFICSIFWLDDNNIFFIILLFLSFLLLYHFKPIDLNINFNNQNKKHIIIVLISTTIMFTCIAIVGILRYKLFNSPNFDLGIPGQNFYYLKKVGIPFSTCERNILLSHFNIHFSPIFYLILPIYYLFSDITTLQIISALLISSSTIPIYLLCKNHKVPILITIILCLIFCTYAPAICSTYYDFHENLFLTPMLLWLFYFYEKNNNIGIIILVLLVLLIKEDSALYIIIFSIFTLFDKKPKYGIPMLIFSILYFITVIYFLKTYGTGIMTDRYNNLIYNDSSILGVIKTILINPGYFLKQLIISPENNLNKIKYIIELLLPLGFIPLYQKEKRNYLLLLPMLLTIMTTYEYSYNINFHYSCGIIAFLFYTSIKSIKENKINYYLFVCLIASILLFKTYAFPEIEGNIKNYFEHKSELIKMEKMLNEIPKNASINASAFLLPHLTNRDIIYEVYYHNDIPDIDYVVLDTRYNDYLEHYENYINNGYTKHKELKNKILILKK